MQDQATHKDRNSAVELLRLLSICGIICMHIYGHVTEGVVDLAYYVFINTLCNCGVSLFVLISGFYTIKPTISGGIKIILITIFYSVLSYMLKTPRGGYCLKGISQINDAYISSKILVYFCLFCFVLLFGSSKQGIGLIRSKTACAFDTAILRFVCGCSDNHLSAYYGRWRKRNMQYASHVYYR